MKMNAQLFSIKFGRRHCRCSVHFWSNALQERMNNTDTNKNSTHTILLRINSIDFYKKLEKIKLNKWNNKKIAFVLRRRIINLCYTWIGHTLPMSINNRNFCSLNANIRVYVVVILSVCVCVYMFAFFGVF